MLLGSRYQKPLEVSELRWSLVLTLSSTHRLGQTNGKAEEGSPTALPQQTYIFAAAVTCGHQTPASPASH